MRSLLLASLVLPLAMQAQTAPATQLKAAESHGPINWVTLEQAQEQSKKDGKPIMIDVFTQLVRALQDAQQQDLHR